MNIFVGNLSNDVTEEDLNNLFSEFGQVKEVKIIRDMFTQQTKGLLSISLIIHVLCILLSSKYKFYSKTNLKLFDKLKLCLFVLLFAF